MEVCGLKYAVLSLILQYSFFSFNIYLAVFDLLALNTLKYFFILPQTLQWGEIFCEELILDWFELLIKDGFRFLEPGLSVGLLHKGRWNTSQLYERNGFEIAGGLKKCSKSDRQMQVWNRGRGLGLWHLGFNKVIMGNTKIIQ